MVNSPSESTMLLRQNTPPPVPLTISVVIPTYNSSQTLERALQSVARQTLPALEIIVVDDGSAAEEVDAVRHIVQLYPAAILVELPENQGPSIARNSGWAHASGEWIAFLDSDDAWHHRKLEMQSAALLAEPEAVLIGTQICVADASESEPIVGPDLEPRQVSVISRLGMLVRNPVSTPSVLIRRAGVARFNPDARHAEDYELWIVLSRSGPIVRVEMPLTICYKPLVGAGGLSGQMYAMIRAEYKAHIRLWRAGILTTLESVFALACLTLRVFRRVVASRLQKVAHVVRRYAKARIGRGKEA